jgi:kynurenine formamidase
MIDLSHPLDPSTPVYPGDPPVAVTVLESTSDAPMEERRRLNSSRVCVGLHSGTHLDAPFHFFGDAATIDRVDLGRCVGPAALVKVAHDPIGPEHLRPHERLVRSAGRVVLNTGWHHRWGRPGYFSDHPVLTGAAAELLVAWGVVLVGVDTPSVDRPPFDAHLALLGHGVLILENLTNLDAIGADVFTIAALPLKLAGRDGSPVRAVALDCGVLPTA